MVYSDGKIYGIRWFRMDDKYEKKFTEEIAPEQKQVIYRDFIKNNLKKYRFSVFTRCYSLMNSDSFYWAWKPLDYNDVLQWLTADLITQGVGWDNESTVKQTYPIP